jgi:hypothetical protein
MNTNIHSEFFSMGLKFHMNFEFLRKIENKKDVQFGPFVNHWKVFRL